MLLCVCAGNITRTVIALRTADSFCHCLVSLCPLVTQPDLCGSEHRPRPPVPCLSDWLSSLLFLHTLPPVSARLTVTAAVLPRLACLGEHSTLSVSLVWTQKTIDRWLCPVVRSDDVRNERRKKKKKNEQRGKVAACKSGDENRRTQPRRTQKWHSVSTVPKDLRSQSTFIAVAGLDCVEKLTEQWVQLWPRSAWLASQPISRPDVRHSDYFIYILLVFHFYFLPPSSLPGAGSLKGKEKER